MVATLIAISHVTKAANEPGNVNPLDAVGATPIAPAISPLPTSDNSAESVLRDVGMFGTWASDCQRPASLDNPHVIVSSPGGGVVLETSDVGPDYAANRYSVLTARRLSASQVEVGVIFRPGVPGEERQTLVLEMGKGTRRTMINRIEGGEIRVRHGVVLSSGVKTPVLKKCG